MGVMEGESAVRALFGPELDRLEAEGESPDDDLQARIDAVRADYEDSSTRVTPRPGVTWTPCSTPSGSGTGWASFSGRRSTIRVPTHLGAFTLPEAGPVSAPMRRAAKIGLLVLVLTAAVVAVWFAGGLPMAPTSV